jgi:hypothetical protein
MSFLTRCVGGLNELVQALSGLASRRVLAQNHKPTGNGSQKLMSRGG